MSAVVVAAGQSQRFRKSLEVETENSARPNDFRSKALIEMGGKALIVHTLERLSVLALHEVVVVVSESDADIFRSLISSLELPPHHPQVKISYGGASRKDSVRLGLENLEPIDRVCIHDGARPFLTRALLERLNAASLEYGTAIPGLPVVDTIKEVDPQNMVLRTIDRSRLVRVQTPQFFKWREILEAHRRLKESPQEFTDDASLFEALEIPVKTVLGEASNIKVTTVEDLPRLIS